MEILLLSNNEMSEVMLTGNISSYINHFRALSDPLDHGQVHQQPAGHQADPHSPVYVLWALNIRGNVQGLPVPEICCK